MGMTPVYLCVVAILSAGLAAAAAAAVDTSQFARQYWEDFGADEIDNVKGIVHRDWKAKNVILFIGDGFGTTARTAARIFQGQEKKEVGEMNELSMETLLPYAAFSKTFDMSQQVCDSASSAFAILSGVKTKSGTFGYDATQVNKGSCDPEARPMPTIADHMKAVGRRVALVTSTRVTHATPAALYAKSPHRDWEATAGLFCQDIASQLIEADHIDLAFGGGRAMFLPKSEAASKRDDSRDLIQEFSDRGGIFIRDSGYLNMLQNLDKRVIGTFEDSHLAYVGEESQSHMRLKELTVKALELLEEDGNGYFLLVEGGRIDHAQHATEPYLALKEAVHFDETISEIMGMINLDETLVIATADHSHAFNIVGYPDLNNPILGYFNNNGSNKATLTYGIGPGFGQETPPSNDNSYTPGYHYPAALHHGRSNNHGGDDVWMLANGPMAHLFQGVRMQSYIGHVMQYATCTGLYKDKCRVSSNSLLLTPLMPLLAVIFAKLVTNIV